MAIWFVIYRYLGVCLIHNTAWSTIMPFDGIVQDLRCPVYTSPIWGYAQKGYFTAFVVVHVLYCY